MRRMIKNIALLLALIFLLMGDTVILPVVSAQGSPPVLAFYYAWFDENTWTSGQSAGSPVQPYRSADRATIERHVSEAQSAGIDALVQSWYGPSENPTETNFRTLLETAQAKGLRAAVDFEVTSPFLGDSGTVAGALATLMSTHAQHPAYFRYQGKPVIFFWRQQQFPVETWAAIRNQVDPNRNSLWIAEGTDISYQAIFDGHHLYSIAWAASPADQLAKWGNRVRAYEADNQVDRLWVATVMPGYDDTRLPRSNSFAVARHGGEYLRETWQGALASQPDMLIITSFNEWLEGTQIEPGASYGNLYLDVTRELVTALKGNPPPAPIPAVAAAQDEETPVPPEPTPSGPYISIGTLTNVRGGPILTSDRVGQLPAGSMVSVVGQTESGDWWQVAFEDGPDGKGWISAEVVEFSGDPADVPVVAAPTPPAPTASATATAEGAAENNPSDEPAATATATAPGEAVQEEGSPGEPATTAADQTAADAPRIEVPAGEVNLRNGPGLEFELAGILEENSSAPVVAANETGDWWQIEYTDGEGGVAWVADAVVDFIGNEAEVPLLISNAQATVTPTPAPTEPVIAGSVEAQDAINVRSEPSLEGSLVGGLYLGDSANVLAVSADGDWWQIEFPDSADGVGWVSADFVRFEGDRELVPIFGVGTPTPTPGATDTPTATSLPSPTSAAWPTFAPTATSIYQATAAALVEQRGTPDPALREVSDQRRSGFQWSNLPWGILSFLLVLIFLWYQFLYRRRRFR